MFYVPALLLDNVLIKCVVTVVVLFSIVAFKTLTFHKGYTRGDCCYKFYPDFDNEKSLKIGIYLMKLRRTKQSVAF